MYAEREAYSTPVIRASGVSRIFNRKKDSVTAISSLDMVIPAGQMTAFVGPDGAGKTTLLRMFCGLLAPTSGRLEALGYDISRDAQAVQNLISYMPQRFGLYEDLSVQENLDLYADLHGVSREERNLRFAHLLDMTDLAAFTARPAGKLSGGMKQKLALACALVRSPKLLLLDEPSVGVDPLSRHDLWIIIEKMVREEQLSVIVSTAYMDEAERCAKVFVFHEGSILAQGSPAELSAMTDDLCYEAAVPQGMSARLLQSWMLGQPDVIMDAVPQGDRVRFVVHERFRGKPLPDTLLSAVPAAEESQGVLAVPPRLEDSFMLLLKRHCDAEAAQPRSEKAVPWEKASRKATEKDEAVIEVRDLVRRFGSFTAVDKTSFTVRRGEVFGLLGPNGAGKTTTFRMLCGLLPASGGHLRVAGEDLRKAAAPARAKVGYVAQKFSLYGNLSVLENLRFFGGVYGLGRAELALRIEEKLREFDLSDHRDDISGTMPAGFKQRLSMAAGLLHGPEILFLDEPTSGIDPLARRLFWKRITELAEAGTTIIITTHFMEEAEYCDRMLIQDAGQVLALGTPSEVRQKGGHARYMEEAFIDIVEKARASRALAEGGKAS